MKRNYTNLKSIGFYLLLLAGAAITIYSCKKDRDNTSDTELPKLKVWYESMIAKNQSEFAELHPLWNSVYVNKQGKFTVYEIALNKANALVLSTGKININERASKVNLRLLLFEDNASKKIKYASYMYVEDDNDQNIKAIHYKSFGKLSGRVLYYHQNGQMANGWIYKDGKLIAGTSSITEKQYLFMQQNKLSGKPGAKLMTETRTECEGVLAETYFWGCTSVNGSDKNCSWHYKGTTYITVCHTVRDMASDLPQDEGDGGYVPPVNYDCNGDENGSAFYTEDCGCIGGNTGITECLKEIKDSVNNPCIKAQLSLAQNAKTTIRNMLNEEFATANFNDRDIVFYDITTLADTIAGTTHGNSAYSFIINLNKNTLPEMSKEYILSTIYHEILHAYMDTQIGKDASGNYLISNQHQTMADKYVFLMTGALKIAFPGISDRDAWALSWGGLEHTPFYITKLSENERLEIQNLMNRHRKGTAANLRHGTYCN